jgi:hypothetical protein
MDLDQTYVGPTLRFDFIMSYFTLGLGVPVSVTPTLIGNLPWSYWRSMQADELRNRPDVKELAEKCKESRLSAVTISFPSTGIVLASARFSRFVDTPLLSEWTMHWKTSGDIYWGFLLERSYGWPSSGVKVGLENVVKRVDLFLLFNRVIDLFKSWTLRGLVRTERLTGFTLSSPVETLYVQFEAWSISLISLRGIEFTLQEDRFTYADRSQRMVVLSRDELLVSVAKFEAEHRDSAPLRYIGAPRPRDRSPSRKGQA